MALHEDADFKEKQIRFLFDALTPCTARIAQVIGSEDQPAIPLQEVKEYEPGFGLEFACSLSSFLPTSTQVAPETQSIQLDIKLDCRPSVEHPDAVTTQVTRVALVAYNSDTGRVRAIKQTVLFSGTREGQSFILYDVYGAPRESDPDFNYPDCVICLCEASDTVVLPCRHMCVCSGCAASFGEQTSRCPICRAPVRTLLRITENSATDKAGQQEAASAVEVTEEPPRSSPSTSALVTPSQEEKEHTDTALSVPETKELQID